MSDTFARTADGAVIRLERRYPHAVGTVWRAVTEPAHLAAWFPSRVEIDLRVGGEVRFSGEENLPDSTGRVTDADPPHLVAFTWEDDHIRVELAADGDGTLLRLTHTFGDVYGAASFASGWEACLTALADVVAGREPQPHRPSGADHDRYLRLFGLDDGTVEPADGAWRVRFERQLTQDRDEVEKVVAGWPATPDLRDGTGHGPRLVLALSAPTREAADALHAEWKARIDRLEAAGVGA
jgi:uncharacterized protein YndB with AHSA1/START domain